MGESARLFRGVFQNGVIVPETALPDGTPVEFQTVGPLAFTPEEQAEFDGWEKIGDEAWAMIDWEEGKVARDSG